MDFLNPASLNFEQFGVGRLGATVSGPVYRQVGETAAHAAQIDMIERRILRIEKALRQAGIEVESIPLARSE